ncbi:Myb-like DNA-binding domain protein [Apiospora arundinis]|uniref:Myb-like DNA-binding domain protein n=1 Tax=Apiospora arundinis TaxID=335852 RepID=A0ABR2HRW1_9PEZI
MSKPWTKAEDQLLRDECEKYGPDPISFFEVSKAFGSSTVPRSQHACRRRLDRLIEQRAQPERKKKTYRKWEDEEFERLSKAVDEQGKSWKQISEAVGGGRTASECASRGRNLRRKPTGTKVVGLWTQEEDKTLLKLAPELQGWDLVAENFPGRSDTACRKRYKRLTQQPKLMLDERERHIDTNLSPPPGDCSEEDCDFDWE